MVHSCTTLPPALPLAILSLLPKFFKSDGCLPFFSVSGWRFQRNQEEKHCRDSASCFSLFFFLWIIWGAVLKHPGSVTLKMLDARRGGTWELAHQNGQSQTPKSRPISIHCLRSLQSLNEPLWMGSAISHTPSILFDARNRNSRKLTQHAA